MGILLISSLLSTFDVQQNPVYPSNTEIKLGILYAILAGIGYVLVNLLSLMCRRNKKMQEVTEMIKKFKENKLWQTYEETITALEVEYRFSRDFAKHLQELRDYKNRVDEKIRYLENDWPKEIVAPSIFDGDYECWASEARILECMGQNLEYPTRLLDDIREIQKTFGETKEKIERLVLEIPETQDGVVLREIVRVKNKIQKVYAQYGDAASIQAKMHVINEMMSVFEELEILSDVVKISINDGSDATEIVEKYSDDIGMLLRMLQGSLRSSSKETVV